MTMLVKMAKAVMNFMFLFFKLMPVKQKVSMISRQSDTKPLDMIMLEDCIKEKYDDVEVVCLCKTVKRSISGLLSYGIHMIRQMYHIATSKVVVIDGYCMGVSMLAQRKELKVIQMWHALGSLKKFGKSIFGLDEGRDESLSEAMNMHGNYHTIFTSSSLCAANFAEAFGYDKKQVKVYPLPRVDVLKDRKWQEDTAERILREYPQLKEKKNIVYAPTFRKDANVNCMALENLASSVDYNKYNFIIKAHPLMKVDIDHEGIINDNKFSSIDMFCIADYVVLDYSAIVYEAALMKKPLFFYAFDLQQYTEGRSFYIDYEKEMPGMISGDAQKIMEFISNEKYDIEAVEEFADKYIEVNGNCAENIADYILDIIK